MRGLVLAVCSFLGGCAPVPEIATAPTEEASAAHQVEQDPAVAHANRLAGEDAYRSHFSGEGDARIHYVEAGEGPTVLFVHGFPSFWYVWRDQMEALRPCRRVIAIDAPGAGLSGKPLADEAYRAEALAKRLHALIGELAPDERITLVGHDWGGALAWSYAQWDSSRLDRLAVFSAPPTNILLDLLTTDPEQREASRYMPRLTALDRDIAGSRAFTDSMYELAYQRMVDTGVLTVDEGELFRSALAREGALYSGVQWYKANVPEFENLDPSEHYWPARGSSTDIPILLVRGSEDQTFVKRMAEVAQREAPQLEVVELEGVGHWTPFEKPKAANAALSGFILKPSELCG